MPVIHRERGYRFYFNSDEGNEPAHIHIKGEKGRMKVWLKDLVITNVRGIPGHEQNKLLGIIEVKRKEFISAWNKIFK